MHSVKRNRWLISGFYAASALVLPCLTAGIASAQALPAQSPDQALATAATQALNPPSSASPDRSTTDQGTAQANASTVFQPTALGANTGAPQPPIEARALDRDNYLSRNLALREPPKPGEFEAYVSSVVGKPIARFGQELLLPGSRDFGAPATSTVPPDYRLNVGDTVVLYLTGSVGGTVQREIDTDGNIFLPSVGSVHLAGVLYRDLRKTVIGAVGREYRYFDVSVTVKSLRGVRVYVTGFANNPGAFTVGSLSTLVNAVFQAGGPSAGGSFRSVKLYRNGREIADFDLYTLLRNGARVGDEVLQNEDVLFIPPAGEQVAVLGSVQREAIYELKPGESLADAVSLAGGLNVMADPDRLILYRTGDAVQRGPIEVPQTESLGYRGKGGDIIQVLSRGSLINSVARQSVLVRVEGEVNNPGNYYVPPNTPLPKVIEMAGGLSSRAFVYGSRLERRSVRDQQQASYAEAIDQLEFSLASAPLVASSSVSETRIASEMASARQVVELLRKKTPDGRVVMNINYAAPAFPDDLLLEANDRLVVPTRPTTVGVFGAVFRPGSFLIEGSQMRIKDYIERAGGLQRAGDGGKIFVVRANGDVLTRKRGILNARALPGDIAFVPIRTTRTDIWQRIRDITAVIFQLGVTAAAVNSIK